MRRLFTLLVLTSLMAQGALAQTIIFRWVDSHGNLHVTDTLSDVPEPFYSIYAAKVKALQDAKEQGTTPAPMPVSSAEAAAPPSSPVVWSDHGIDNEAIRRAQWKAQMTYWRNELLAAMTSLSDGQAELDSAMQNPILRETPAVRARVIAGEDHQVAALARVNKAKHMLLDELPARARKDLVPQAWLQ